MILRAISHKILEDLHHKIVLLSGPRQTGKTTCAKNLLGDYQYLNFDDERDRSIIRQRAWDRARQLIVFDELHKLDKWKRFLKGVYDTEGINPMILVTGSARLEILRNVGDSLAGRFFQHRLYPFDLKEGTLEIEPEKALDRLLSFSGFPEPYLAGDEKFYLRWRRSHLDSIIRQDLIDLEQVRDIPAIFTLIDLLHERVGTPVAHATLARAVGRDPKTITSWITILEKLYVIFKVPPYSKKLREVIRKESKYYFFDYAGVNDQAARLENLVAVTLLKELHRIQDQRGSDVGLYYLRTKTKREIDFLAEINRQARALIEVKLSDEKPQEAFNSFAAHFKQAAKVQLVRNLSREATYPTGLEIRRLSTWLREFNWPL